MVDASIRALELGGWINFRMRAMLMSFASYHLWLDWRPTSIELARLFLDYEPGIHYPQAQMQSGTTGINTLRIYSPAKQALDHDPTGAFIRRYVPELEPVPDEYLAEPHLMPPLLAKMIGFEIGRDYPEPIVDHRAAYRHARDRMDSVVQSEEGRQEARRVLLKHAGRGKRRGDESNQDHRYRLCCPRRGLTFRSPPSGVAPVIMLPFQILGIWFRGLLALAILGGGIYLLTRWLTSARLPGTIAAPIGASPASRPRAAEPGRAARRRPAAPGAPVRVPSRLEQADRLPGVRPGLLTWGTLGGLIRQGVSA